MKDIIPVVDKDTLLVFDIDNTLVCPITDFGSDQWLFYIVDRYMKVFNLSHEVALDKGIELWVEVQKQIMVEPVETDTPEMVKNFQQKGIKIMGLTARKFADMDFTVKHLDSAGIHLGDSTIYDSELELTSDDSAKFSNGILYVGEKNNKAKVLDLFLKKIGKNVSKIVFVDDKEKHVTNLENVFGKSSVSFTGFRYGATDDRVKSFKQDMADLDRVNEQLEKLNPGAE
ncbi:MAG: DUF2608 domain-containing protein [Candidatus Riflebacteria bacterium]|nr:DUF2608 domain-containing protein [Candidatus Riflebacteria bacterium]